MNSNLIKKTEAQCMAEHAPSCQAACPLHLPVRMLINLIKKDDFDGAAELFQKYSYFPRLVAKACSAPCENACQRKELDEGVAINLLEKAVAANATFSVPRIVPEMQIRKKIALIGGGMGALAAAWALYEKGFALTIFEKTGNLGGRACTAANVSAEDIAVDLAPLTALPIEFRFHTEIGGDISMAQILEEYDGVYLSGDKTLSDTRIDRKTLQTANPKVFAGGSMLREDGPYSIVQSIADGRRAAVSLDRYLKNKSFTAARYGEGYYQSQLKVSLQGMGKKARAVKSTYTRDECLTEAERCLDCHCTSCIRECKLAERFGKFTKSYIKEIADTAPVMGGGTDKKEETDCTLCGLCKDICPNALPLSGGEKAVGKVETSNIDLPVRDMLFSNSDEFSLCRHRSGLEESRYLFFPGCQMAATMPEYIGPAYRYLQDKLDSVGIFLGCCGAPAEWAGQSKLFEKTMSELLTKWSRMGKPIMIVGCTTCYQQFKAAEPLMRVKLLWEVFAEYGLPQAEREPHTVAVHDSCTVRYEKEIQDAVRRILQEAGYQVEELAYSREKTKCCGYSGLVFCENKEAALKAVAERISESPLDYVAYCTVCRNYFVSAGKPTYHIFDVIFGQDTPETACRPAPGLRQQEENRRILKRDLLQEFYQDGREQGDGPRLFISPQVRRLLEERLIDEGNIEKVIRYAEEHNRKLLRPADNHFVAGFKPGIITYWVEYAPKDEGYEIYNAYSHRISMEED
ncbi:pyridine nucleotide-disulfide oxidoreductase/dicluster-binding protein [Sporomusa acidovorans]|uniref:4Fe-4S ferredoxin-type domain-containing protein n=1 Tax=Sporomusa acidovorans (strain ATCC 49682 / DSM 3132 / Mol) TaxID=1123286 RepID=A0ABZ3IXR5_SPOA4|nr:pyridine nucleotide-disulfide oxidoreductase/dicluster-binding protein [Sporomusa acidovorans]OZC23369.1 NADPH-Fe(3+) oxidoreductase subunit beta [Sporomusa acidovorans DSM 3132]SDE43299.1 Cysteine-rich domain-containing protein [Sporomusa acidovorans]